MVALAVAIAVEGEVVVALAVTGSPVLVAGGVSVVVVGAVEEQKPVLMVMKPNLSGSGSGSGSRERSWLDSWSRGRTRAGSRSWSSSWSGSQAWSQSRRGNRWW